MYIQDGDITTLAPWLQKELVLPRSLDPGDRGSDARRLQEWLVLHGFTVEVDGIYGLITSEALAQFQQTNFLPTTGLADEATWQELTRPLRDATAASLNFSSSFVDAVSHFAQQHLKQHPREVGGRNQGPWVRTYMNGKDGPSSLWCAGFVCFLMLQAAEALQIEAPLRRTGSCDNLAMQAKSQGTFVSGAEVERDGRFEEMNGSIFLIRKTRNDWIHTGLVVDANRMGFLTVEGNTNDDGAREGYEVCSRMRGYGSADFILLDKNT